MERLFFRRWQDKEAALRRVVGHAGFITAPAPLIAAAREAIACFGEGISVSIHLRDEAGDYRDYAGDVSVDRDHPVIVQLRAEAKPVRPEGRGPAGIELALPMTHRKDLLGFVLIGAKPGGGDYRVDEVEILGWAAHQIGLDLYALERDRLETIVRDQSRQIAVLEARGSVNRRRAARTLAQPGA